MRNFLSFIFVFISFLTPIQVLAGDSVNSGSISGPGATNQRFKQPGPRKCDVVRALLDSEDPAAEYVSTIDPTGHKELLITPLARKLDMTITGFGFWGVDRLLTPLANPEIIQKRQERIQFLLEHDDVLQELTQYLQDLRKIENDLMAYWNEHDVLNRNVKSMYYSIFSSTLNDSQLALELANIFDLKKSMLSLLSVMAVEGTIQEILTARSSGKEVSILGAIKKGLSAPFKYFMPNKNTYDMFRAQEALNPEAPADRLSEGALLLLSGTGYEQYLYARDVGVPAVVAGGFVGLYGLGSLANWFNGARAVYQRLMFLIKVAASLQHRLVKVSSFMQTLRCIDRLVQGSASLADDPMINSIHRVIGSQEGISDSLKRCFDLLSSGTFSGEADYIFSRGRVLLAQKLLVDCKHELVPVLQGLAELDAYCSLTRLYQEHQGEQNSFCFAEFTNDQKASIDLEGVWLPLIPTQSPTKNCLKLGYDNVPTKSVITGPNMGGKSMLVKSIGDAVVMAHSCGVVPADKACMSFFTRMRTSFDPQENINKNLSSFMAQKVRMSEMRDFVLDNAQDGNTFILADEPYRGTIEQSSEELSYDFAHAIARVDNCCALMAVHYRKPTLLATDTGCYTNHQVEIKETSPGVFERTFKLLPNLCHWWFNDVERRRRYLAWLQVPKSS